MIESKLTNLKFIINETMKFLKFCLIYVGVKINNYKIEWAGEAININRNELMKH